MEKVIPWGVTFFFFAKEEPNIKILVVEPMKKPYEKEIDGSLASMQKLVGGTIEAVYPFPEDAVALVCHGEGKLHEVGPERLAGLLP